MLSRKQTKSEIRWIQATIKYKALFHSVFFFTVKLIYPPQTIRLTRNCFQKMFWKDKWIIDVLPVTSGAQSCLKEWYTMWTATTIINRFTTVPKNSSMCRRVNFCKHIKGNTCHGIWNANYYTAALKHLVLQIFESNWISQDS